MSAPAAASTAETLRPEPAKGETKGLAINAELTWMIFECRDALSNSGRVIDREQAIVEIERDESLDADMFRTVVGKT